jgi:hypothetical protein
MTDARRIEILIKALNEIRDTIDGCIDIKDGSDGRPQPNIFMNIDQIASEALDVV